MFEETLEAALLALWLGVSLALAGRGLQRKKFLAHRGEIAISLLLLIAAWASRRYLVAPEFLHVNFRGVALVDRILSFPEPAVRLGSYGQVSFLVLGLAARFLGQDFAAVAHANELISVIALGLIGWTAARFSGRAISAPIAIALGLLSPPLLRVAASEDAHNIAVLFGFAALLGADEYGESGDALWLIFVSLSTVLMAGSRQTLYPWVPCVLVLAIARGGFAIVRRPSFLIAFCCTAAFVIFRVMRTLVDEPGEVGILLPMFTSPSLLVDLLRHHALLDVTRFAAPSLPFLFVGAWRLAKTERIGRALTLLLAGTFLITLPFGFPPPGVELGFRLPMLTLAIVATAVGVEWSARTINTHFGEVTPRRSVLIALALTTALALSPPLLPAWRELAIVSPPTAEYAFVERVAPSLPAHFKLVQIKTAEPTPGYRLPLGPLIDADREVEILDAGSLTASDFGDVPVLLLAGVQCRAWSVAERIGLDGKSTPTLAALQQLFAAPVAHRVAPNLHVPTELRPECVRLLAHAEPLSPSLTIDRPEDENPFVLYGGSPIEIRFYRLTAPPN